MKEASERPYIVWFHLYAVFRRDKSIKMENSGYLGQGELSKIRNDWECVTFVLMDTWAPPSDKGAAGPFFLAGSSSSQEFQFGICITQLW